MIDPIALQIELLINKAKKSLSEQTPEEKKRLAFIVKAIEKDLK